MIFRSHHNTPTYPYMIKKIIRLCSVTLLILFFIVSSDALGQVSGILVDEQSGKPISKASIFINNTSLAVLTNDKGEFALDGIAPGFVELVIYRDGYKLFKSSIRIQVDKAFKLNLKLANDDSPKAGKPKQDAEYKSNLQWFERALLGEDDNAISCRITYPKNFSISRTGDLLEVSSAEPLVVENNSLGYKVTCYLQEFKAEVENITFAGALKFDTLTTKDPELKKNWERNRLIAYWGSGQHFFHTLVKGTTTDEGFVLFDANKKSINPESIVSTGKMPEYRSISLVGETTITFQMESMETGVKTKNPEQTSTLVSLGAIDVTPDGILFNPRSLKWKGHLSKERLASMVPQNYVPTASLESEKVDWKNFSLLREKAYLHLDRDYYYPRETIWLKAYMGYSMTALRDTLSHTLYVELISPEKKIIDSKVYPIKAGVSWGELALSEKLVPGQYYLRAYTNWMRNYGDSALFVRAIPILDFNQNIEYEEENNVEVKSSEVLLSIEKNSFKVRDPIALQVIVMDEKGNPEKANLSVSVTDAVASIPMYPASITSPKSLSIESLEVSNKYFEEVTYFMERGLSFSGVVKDAKNVPTPARIQVIQGNMDNLINLETDDKGEFLITGLKYVDSMVFAFQPTNKKGKLLPKVELIPRVIPPLSFKTPAIPLKYRQDNAMQRIQNTYQAGEQVRVLDAVEIAGKKIETLDEKKDIRIYGTPNYTVTGDKLGGTVAGMNLLVALQGKVPGLRVTEVVDAGGFRTVKVQIRGASSLTGDTEPLILVDGVPFPDANSLFSIDPSMVDRIEVVTSASPQFGSRGTNGVISIFMKTGYSAQGEVQKNYISYKIPGYSRSKAFVSPDYSASKESQNPDFRTTIFWKPNLLTDETGKTSVQFYAADLVTRYRIVVEGVTESGRPVRAVKYVTVE